jgi:putative endonuclease
MKDHNYFVYLLSNTLNTVIYSGVTNNLERRMLEHKSKHNSGFSAKYNCNKLVYFEEYQWIEEAIGREKQIKGGSRLKKINLINSMNPGWVDLSLDWFTDNDILFIQKINTEYHKIASSCLLAMTDVL